MTQLLAQRLEAHVLEQQEREERCVFSTRLALGAVEFDNWRQQVRELAEQHPEIAAALTGLLDQLEVMDEDDE